MYEFSPWHARAVPLSSRFIWTMQPGLSTAAGPESCRYRSSEGVIVAPALKTASVVIVPCECISGSFAKAMTTHPIVPISAVIAVIAAGRNLSDGSFLTSDIRRPQVLEIKSLKSSL
jgi:hypothetical protein